ncbi:hypothetical protein OIO90_006528 [Microbotryomycetes sp. JL221]|nr:hypothetical protein OIO90_006528 [Microbotryomycetes sp. JL221]
MAATSRPPGSYAASPSPVRQHHNPTEVVAMDAIINALDQLMQLVQHTFQNYIRPLIPSPSLILQSIGFLVVVTLCISTSLLAWVSFYSITSVSSLGTRERVWLQYGRFQAPHAIVSIDQDKFDLANSPYDISLDLVVPVSERNLDIGNFMVELNVLADNGQSIVTAARPATLIHPPRNPPAPPCEPTKPKKSPSTLWTLMSPSTYVQLVMGPPQPNIPTYSIDETQRLRIKLLDKQLLANKRSGLAKFVKVKVGRDDAHHWFDQSMITTGGGTDKKPLSTSTSSSTQEGGSCGDVVATAALAVAAVAAANQQQQGVGSRVATGPGVWSGGHGELQVYESWINFDAKLTGLRYVLYYHPILSFLVFVTAFTTLELVAALLAWAVWASSSSSTRSSDTTTSSHRPRPRSPPQKLSSSSASRTTTVQPEESETTTSSQDQLSPFISVDNEEQKLYEIEQERQRRLRGLSGIVGMSEVDPRSSRENQQDDEQTEMTELTTSETDNGDGESGEEGALTEEGSSSWEGVEREGISDIKDEDEGATVAGSATTRATRSTFGPSVTGTSTSTRVGAGGAGMSSDSVMRERRRAEQQLQGQRSGDDG